MAVARRFADRHWFVVCFEHPDRAGDVSVADRAVMADVGEVPGHARHAKKYLVHGMDHSPPIGFPPSLGLGKLADSSASRATTSWISLRVKLMPRVVGRVKCDRSTPAVDRHEFRMIDRESRPVHHDELERPERLPANLVSELVQGHFPPPSRLQLLHDRFLEDRPESERVDRFNPLRLPAPRPLPLPRRRLLPRPDPHRPRWPPRLAWRPLSGEGFRCGV